MASGTRILGDEATTAGLYSDVYDDAYGGPTDTISTELVQRRTLYDDAAASDLTHGVVISHTPANPQGGVHLRLWDMLHTQIVALLPQYGSIHASIEFNDDGEITFDYALSALGADTLVNTKVGLIELREGNVLIQMGLYDQDADDAADEQGPDRNVGVTANGTLSLLGWAAVYPEKGFNTPQYASFVNASPGGILRTLLTRAQGRGTLDGIHGPLIQPTFDATFDSAGVPWPLRTNLRYEAGKSLRDVLADLIERGFVDTRMRGLVWDCYVKDTYLAADHPGTYVRVARETTSAPRQRSRADLRTTLLLTGDANLSTEVNSPDRVMTYGRREGYSGQSGVSSGAILQLIGQQVIGDLNLEKEGFTATYDRDGGGPQPFSDYDAGHFVRADWYRDPNTGVNLPLRVRTMSVTYDADGIRSAELELNDLFLERAIVVQRRVDALTNGTVSIATAPPTPVVADTSTPNAPSDVLVTSQIIVNKDGRARAVAIISWPLVTSNDDATTFDDDGGYHVSWSIDGSAYTAAAVTEPGVGVAYAVGLPPGATFIARVSAADYNGHVSGSTYSAPVVLEIDRVGPPPPSKPTVTPFLGSLRVQWDGLDNTGTPMGGDFAHVEAWVATANDPTQATRMGTTLVAAGSLSISNLPYGVPHFVWLRSVDTSGNPKTAPPAGFSQVANATGDAPTQVLAPDLGGGVVGPDALVYKDFDNKVPDGSFEAAANRNRLQQSAGWNQSVWSFVQGGASDGGWCLQANAAALAGTTRTLPLVTGITALSGDKVQFTFNAKGSGSASGQAQLVITVRDSTGAVISTSTLAVSTADGTWYAPPAGSTFTVTFPPNASTYDVAVQLTAAAQIGTWSFDAVQVRQVIQTAVIDQAAVGNAQIAQLAVDEAQIQHVQVEDILAGVLQAAYIALGGGRLTTTGAGQQTGARVELDSLGLRAYSAASTGPTTGKTVEIKSDGTALISGSITGGGLVGGSITGSITQTAASGSRIVIGPGQPDALSGGLDVATVGILVFGTETSQAPTGRITNYEYITTGTADPNYALRLAGGVANIVNDETFYGNFENQVIIWPRDQTDEADETHWHNYGGTFSPAMSAQGVTILVAQNPSGSGYGNASFNFKMHVAGSPVLSAVAASGSGSGLQFLDNQVNIVAFASDALVAINSSDYPTPSSVAVKDLLDEPPGHLAIVRGAASRRFRYKPGHGYNARVRHGPILEELPDELHFDIQGIDGQPMKSIDLADRVGVVWGAVHELDKDLGARVAALEAEIKRLRSRS